jgi:ankyrin repeat protein
MDLLDYVMCLEYVSGQLYKSICRQIYKELEFSEFHDLNRKDKDGQTILMLLIQNNETELAKELLRVGSYDLDVNAKCHKQYTALICAVLNRNKIITTKLLQYPDIDTESNNIYCSTALTIAVNNRDKNMTQLLLKNGSFVSTMTHFGLLSALKISFNEETIFTQIKDSSIEDLQKQKEITQILSKVIILVPMLHKKYNKIYETVVREISLYI